MQSVRAPEKLTDEERAFAVLLRDLEADFAPSFEFTDGALCPRLRKLMGDEPPVAMMKKLGNPVIRKT